MIILICFTMDGFVIKNKQGMILGMRAKKEGLYALIWEQSYNLITRSLSLQLVLINYTQISHKENGSPTWCYSNIFE